MKRRKSKKRSLTSKAPETIPKISWRKRFQRCLSRNLYHILYVTMLMAIWAYVIWNWEKCISMQFFSQFDGNNILFLVGIILMILFFYDIEGKGFKMRRRGAKERLQEIDLAHQIEQREEANTTVREALQKSDNGGKQE